MAELKGFIAQLQSLDRIVIQAHDFPDHDAVSSAFALNYLFQQFDIPSIIVYNGIIDRISLKNLIEQLDIPLLKWTEADVSVEDKIITVDGCIGEKNILDLPGDEIAVIDHHQVNPPDSLWYCDVREDYGATASIVVEYFKTLNIEMPQDIATALQVGLSVDTANLTRGFIAADIEAFQYLHLRSNPDQVNQITRNSVTQKEVAYYKNLLEGMEVNGDIAFASIGNNCPKNMLGVLGDFLLTLDEVNTTILAAPTEDMIQISLRTEDPNINVGQAASYILQHHSLGFGGGHSHMAGGVIDIEKCSDRYSLHVIRDLFIEHLTKS